MSQRHIPRLAGFTLLLDALQAVVSRIECGISEHDWVPVPRGRICRCCLSQKRD